MTKTATLTDNEIIARHDSGVRHRARTELAIVHRVIQTLNKSGFELSVHDGEETITGDERELVNAIFGVDEARLLTRSTGTKDSFVFFVLGNSGHDVICDYGCSLESIIDPILNWIDEELEAGRF